MVCERVQMNGLNIERMIGMKMLYCVIVKNDGSIGFTMRSWSLRPAKKSNVTYHKTRPVILQL